MEELTIIHLTEERRFAYLLSRGAYMSNVRYVDDFGNEVDTFVENDEYTEWEPDEYEQE